MRGLTILAAATGLFLGSCQHHDAKSAPRESVRWDCVTKWESSDTIEELSRRANDAGADRDERCRAIFELFANHVKPGFGPADMARVMLDPRWIDEAEILYQIACFGASLGFDYRDSVSAVILFPCEDAPGWVIRFSLSGVLGRDVNPATSVVGEGGADIVREFLRGTTKRPRNQPRLARSS